MNIYIVYTTLYIIFDVYITLYIIYKKTKNGLLQYSTQCNTPTLTLTKQKHISNIIIVSTCNTNIHFKFRSKTQT
jgi:hypothetical protein